MSRIKRKPDFCICENKSADQLCSNCTADQRLCLRYSDITIPFLLITNISSLNRTSLTAQAGLCRAWSETQTAGVLSQWLLYRIRYNKPPSAVLIISTLQTFMIPGILRVWCIFPCTRLLPCKTGLKGLASEGYKLVPLFI